MGASHRPQGCDVATCVTCGRHRPRDDLRKQALPAGLVCSDCRQQRARDRSFDADREGKL